jgi:hypothetical protein
MEYTEEIMTEELQNNFVELNYKTNLELSNVDQKVYNIESQLKDMTD